MSAGPGGETPGGETPGGEAAVSFCGHCGQRIDAGSHETCAQRLALEPPRFCPRCRRRMKVQVTPRGWSADCVEHGPLRG